jgi:hypothetical protein
MQIILPQLESGDIWAQDYIALLQSKKPIITDKNTKLKISTNLGRWLQDIHFQGNYIVISTDQNSSDILIWNPKISKVIMEWGELKVTIEGAEYSSNAKLDKQQLSASTGHTYVGLRTYQIDVALVLAVKK